MITPPSDKDSDPQALAHLGPEPFETRFNWEYLWQISRNKTKPVKNFIMDSKVVVGVGLFPGLSTSMARHLHQQMGGAKTLEFAVRLSPFSGAGKGNCRLATETLISPTVAFRDGQRVLGPPVGEARSFDFLGSGPAQAQVCSLPDGPLIQRSTGASNVGTSMAVIPGILRFGFKISAILMAIPVFGTLVVWSTFL